MGVSLPLQRGPVEEVAFVAAAAPSATGQQALQRRCDCQRRLAPHRLPSHSRHWCRQLVLLRLQSPLAR